MKISDTAPPPPQPALSVTPNSLDFGTVTAGSSKDLEFTVQNTGDGTLIGTASTSAPFSVVSGGSYSLGAGASQVVVVRFSPPATGSFTANVSFASNGGNASQVVTGTGAAAPAINVTPTTLAFGSVAVGSSADLTFAVDNSGGGTLSGTCSTTAPFSLPNGCSFALTSGQTAVVTVRFSPTATGPFTGNVSFTSNGGDVSSAVTGTGTVKPLITISSISPTSGPAGSIVTIKGKNFGATKGASFVGFGSTQAAINSWSGTQIVAIAPSGPSGLVRVTVTTAAGTSNSKDFTYTTAGSTILFQWPLDDADVSHLNQDYAQFNGIGTNLYHTGLDIGVALNTTVKASADGNIVMIQENDVGCNRNKKGDCQDHGYGNTVIIEHGSMLYSHYSHLNFIEENLKNACPTESKKWKGRDSKRRFCSIPINAGDKLGGVGGSGYGQPACTTPGQTDCYTFPHLHFEIKTFSTLGTTGNDNGEFGYTSKHPDDVKYIDPILELHNLAQASFSRSVSIIENGVSLRVGPGGLGTAEYRVLTTINIGTYEALRESAGTSKPDCPSGWYQIRRSSGGCAIAGNCFVDNSDLSSSVRDAWVCRTFISE